MDVDAGRGYAAARGSRSIARGALGGLLPRYAQLQIAVSAERSAMVAMGVPGRTLDTLAADLRAVVDEPEMVLVGDPRGLTHEQLDLVRAPLDTFGGDCRRLAALGIPETLQHDDLHDGNAFFRDGARGFRLGDACSHPFHTLAVTLRALAYARKLRPGGVDVNTSGSMRGCHVRKGVGLPSVDTPDGPSG